jgi:hypothetical protein
VAAIWWRSRQSLSRLIATLSRWAAMPLLSSSSTATTFEAWKQNRPAEARQARRRSSAPSVSL